MTERHPIGPPGYEPPPSSVPLIRAQHVYLRPLRADDFESWRDVRTRSRAWLEPWESSHDHRIDLLLHSRAAFQQWCASWTRERELDVSYGFGLFVADDRFAGEISLGGVQRGPYQTATIGYWIDRALAGKGYMTQGVLLLMYYAFENLGMHRVEAMIVPRNDASVRVAEKLTLRNEGTAVRFGEVRGTYEDHLRYAITAEEWAERRGELIRRFIVAAVR